MLYCRFCASCIRSNEQQEQETPRVFDPLEANHNDTKVLYSLACLKGEQYRVGDGVYLPPEAFNFG